MNKKLLLLSCLFSSVMLITDGNASKRNYENLSSDAYTDSDSDYKVAPRTKKRKVTRTTTGSSRDKITQSKNVIQTERSSQKRTTESTLPSIDPKKRVVFNSNQTAKDTRGIQLLLNALKEVEPKFQPQTRGINPDTIATPKPVRTPDQQPVHLEPTILHEEYSEELKKIAQTLTERSTKTPTGKQMIGLLTNAMKRIEQYNKKLNIVLDLNTIEKLIHSRERLIHNVGSSAVIKCSLPSLLQMFCLIFNKTNINELRFNAENTFKLPDTIPEIEDLMDYILRKVILNTALYHQTESYNCAALLEILVFLYQHQGTNISTILNNIKNTVTSIFGEPLPHQQKQKKATKSVFQKTHGDDSQPARSYLLCLYTEALYNYLVNGNLDFKRLPKRYISMVQLNREVTKNIKTMLDKILNPNTTINVQNQNIADFNAEFLNFAINIKFHKPKNIKFHKQPKERSITILYEE